VKAARSAAEVKAARFAAEVKAARFAAEVKAARFARAQPSAGAGTTLGWRGHNPRLARAQPSAGAGTTLRWRGHNPPLARAQPSAVATVRAPLLPQSLSAPVRPLRATARAPGLPHQPVSSLCALPLPGWPVTVGARPAMAVDSGCPCPATPPSRRCPPPRLPHTL